MVDNEVSTEPYRNLSYDVCIHNIKESQSDDSRHIQDLNSVETDPDEAFTNLIYCANCDLNYTDAEEYKKHKCRKKHQCTYCDAVFQRYDHLKRHVVSLHSNSKYNICPACNKDCIRQELLLKHVKVHVNEIHSCKCRECSSEFETLHDLILHEYVHMYSDRHVCEYCKKVFKRKDHMLRHVQTIHLHQHTACPICHQKFTRKDHATRHIREKHNMVIPNGKLK